MTIQALDDHRMSWLAARDPRAAWLVTAQLSLDTARLNGRKPQASITRVDLMLSVRSCGSRAGGQYQARRVHPRPGRRG
jgi:hypothetical protein